MIRRMLAMAVAVWCCLSVNAITIKEFFESVKSVDGAEYEKVPVMIASLADKRIKSIETIGIVPVDDDVREHLLSLCDSVEEKEDVIIVKDSNEKEQFRTWMQVEGETFTLIMFNMMYKDDIHECQVMKMTADKEALNDEKFIKFVKEE